MSQLVGAVGDVTNAGAKTLTGWASANPNQLLYAAAAALAIAGIVVLCTVNSPDQLKRSNQRLTGTILLFLGFGCAVIAYYRGFCGAAFQVSFLQ